jgi:hypothetical protein
MNGLDPWIPRSSAGVHWGIKVKVYMAMALRQYYSTLYITSANIIVIDLR